GLPARATRPGGLGPAADDLGDAAERRSTQFGGPLAWLVVLEVAAAARLAMIALTARYQSPWPWEVEVMSRALVETGTLGFDWFGRTQVQPSAFLPPVYPLFVAMLMWIGGGEYTLALRLAQGVVSVVAVALLVL